MVDGDVATDSCPGMVGSLASCGPPTLTMEQGPEQASWLPMVIIIRDGGNTADGAGEGPGAAAWCSSRVNMGGVCSSLVLVFGAVLAGLLPGFATRHYYSTLACRPLYRGRTQARSLEAFSADRRCWCPLWRRTYVHTMSLMRNRQLRRPCRANL